MDFPEPDDVIGPLLAEFMADQQARLSPENYLQYAGVVELLDHYLDRYYRPECRRREDDAPARSEETFCGLSPAVDLSGRFSVFLGDFLPREVGVSPERLRVARTVIKVFGTWLIARGYVIRNKPAGKRANRSERHLPATPYFPGFFQD
jgi:hypothetical protein